jgi:Ca2+-transporting ATPase
MMGSRPSPSAALAGGVPVPSIAATEPGQIAALAIAEVYARLDTRSGGLSSDEAGARLERDGPNTLREPQRRSLVARLIGNFTHLMALLLWIGGGIAVVAGLGELAVAIWLVNLINGLFSFWQEYKAERATELLRKMLPSYSLVLRDGTESQVLAEELVVGDVMILSEGDLVSADGRVVSSIDLGVDQSTLTGESNPVHKDPDPVAAGGRTPAEIPCLVFAGTSVSVGKAKAVVCATGMHTQFGRIADLTETVATDQSPLQHELGRVSYVVSAIAITMGALFFAVAEVFTPMRFAEALVFGLGMIVAFVPEGLLPTVTLSLAMGAQRMARRRALVKRLSAVETLGSTTVICTDKTGTLTQNEMTVRELYVPGAGYRVTGVGYEPTGTIEPHRGSPPADARVGRLLVAAALANDARLLPPDGDGGWVIRGDPTEGAILVAAAKGGIQIDDLARTSPRIGEVPFDGRRKRMSSVNRLGNDRFVFTKGAPMELLDRCDRVAEPGGDAELDDDRRADITASNDAFSRGGLRVLGVAERRLDGEPFEGPDLERSMTFLGLVAMMDPPRPEVAEAVERCHRAGIKIVMITGDYGLTAENIARRVGMIEAPVRIVNGAEIDTMSDAELSSILADEVLIARASPEHKLRIVRALQASGQVVAVTGDGVNDAPALKQADIGVAMGLAGTDVAKEAADVILLDDNFASIANAVEEGRTVFANIKKFTSYIFTSNTPEAVPFVLFALSGGRIPLALGVMPILSIDLGTDLVPALALGAELPEPGVMDLPPRRRTEHIITAHMLVRAYLWLGLLQAGLVMLAFHLSYRFSGVQGWLDLPGTGPRYAAATGAALAAVVATQIGNLFAHRTERTSVFRSGLFTNRLVLIGIASEIAVVVAIVYIPFLNHVIGTGPFPAILWLWLLLFIPPLLVVDEIRKALARRFPRRSP